MRTFLSQEATARCSDCGENERSEMLSSGGDCRATSLDRSPRVLAWLVEEADPNRPAMMENSAQCRSRWREWKELTLQLLQIQVMSCCAGGAQEESLRFARQFFQKFEVRSSRREARMRPIENPCSLSALA
jgi:hypothetical protein